MKRALLLMVCLCAAPLLQAQIYKWRDAQGRVHYSDVPPPTLPGRERALDTSRLPVSAVKGGVKPASAPAEAAPAPVAPAAAPAPAPAPAAR